MSPGCDRCYAETFAERWRGTPGHYFENGFDVQLRPDKLDLPIRWKKPRRIFVNSMSDLFHADIPDDYIAQVFAVMSVAHQHTFQVLTKRHARMRALLRSDEFREQMGWHAAKRHPYWTADEAGWPLPNVWMGVSAENQQWADIRVQALLETPATIRFVSGEPLLGPLNLWHSHCPTHDFGGGMCTFSCPERRRIDWLIVGGESGAGARRMDADWVRSLRDQCAQTGVAFFMKQTGAVLAKEWGCKGKGDDPAQWPEQFPMQFPQVLA